MVGRTNLAHAVERLLDVVGRLHAGLPHASHDGCHGLARGKEQGKRHRDAPERRKRQLTGEAHAPNENHDAGEHRAVEHGQRVAVGVLHHLHVGQHRGGEVGQVAPAEKRQGKLAQAFGHLYALLAAFLVEHVVGVVVLKPRADEEGDDEHGQPQRKAADTG